MQNRCMNATQSEIVNLSFEKLIRSSYPVCQRTGLLRCSILNGNFVNRNCTKEICLDCFVYYGVENPSGN